MRQYYLIIVLFLCAHVGAQPQFRWVRATSMEDLTYGTTCMIGASDNKGTHYLLRTTYESYYYGSSRYVVRWESTNKVDPIIFINSIPTNEVASYEQAYLPVTSTMVEIGTYYASSSLQYWQIDPISDGSVGKSGISLTTTHYPRNYLSVSMMDDSCHFSIRGSNNTSWVGQYAMGYCGTIAMARCDSKASTTYSPINQWETKVPLSSFVNSHNLASALDIYVKKNVYQVTFDANGEGSLNGKDTCCITDYAIYPPQVTPEAGKVCVGWNTKPDGSGKMVKNGSPVLLVSDSILYAQYARDLSASVEVLEWQSDALIVESRIKTALLQARLVEETYPKNATGEVFSSTEVKMADCLMYDDVAVYKIPIAGHALITHPAQMVVLEFFDQNYQCYGKAMIKAPILIENATITSALEQNMMSENDICVLPNAKLVMNSSCTCKNLSIYGGGLVVIEPSSVLTADSILLRGGLRGDSAYRFVYPQLQVQGHVTKQTKWCYDLLINAEQFYALSLPVQVPLSQVRYIDGRPINWNCLGQTNTNAAIYYYDGDKRTRGASGWKELPQDSTFLRRGNGYIITAYSDTIEIAGQTQQQKYGTIRFPMEVDFSTEAETAKEITTVAHGFNSTGLKNSVKKNNAGWNLIGNPYFCAVTQPQGLNNTDIGMLVKSTGEYTWNIGQRYGVLNPDNKGIDYFQQTVDEWTIVPFTNYFVQIGNDDHLTLNLPAQFSLSPKRNNSTSSTSKKASSSTEYVRWLQGEHSCYDYYEMKGASHIGYVQFGSENQFVQVGDHSPVFSDPAIYEKKFRVDENNTLLVVHMYAHVSGHGDGGELVIWSIPELQVGNVHASATSSTYEYTYYVDLSPLIGQDFTFFLMAQDCEPNVHAANARFALGCMENEMLTDFCYHDSLIYMEVSELTGCSYKWYAKSNPDNILGTSTNLILRPTQDETYICEIKQPNIDLPIVHSAFYSNTLCQPFYQTDTMMLTEPIKWRGQTYVKSGVYTDSLVNVCGCDSVYTLCILPAQSVQRDSICEGEAYEWNGHTYYEGGIYNEYYKTEAGFDSVATLELYEFPSYDVLALRYDTISSWDDPYFEPLHRAITRKMNSKLPKRNTQLPTLWNDPYLDEIIEPESDIDDPELWKDPYVNNSILSDLDDPTLWGDPFKTDSMITPLDLDDPKSWEDPYRSGPITFDTICQGELYEWHGRVYREAGLYGDTLQTIHGCDSIVYLKLTDSICCLPQDTLLDTTLLYMGDTAPSILWFGNEYSQPGIYYDTLVDGTVKGCDSTGVLILHVLYSDTILTCDEGSVTFVTPFGEWESGDCDTLTGCLSMASDGTCLVEGALYVRRLTVDSVIEDTTVCAGTVVTWHGLSILDEGTYYDTLPYWTQASCDSLYCRMTIHHTSPVTSDTTDTICFGADYEWHGQSVTDVVDSLELVDVLTSVDGCDSVVTLHLYVYSQPQTQMTNVTVCDDSVYLWHTYRDTMVADSGVYYDTLWSSRGCYSQDYVLILQHHSCACDTAYSHTYQSLKEKDLPTFVWNDMTLPSAPANDRKDTTLIYTTTKMDHSCDSIATLHLHVLFPCELPTVTLPYKIE